VIPPRRAFLQEWLMNYNSGGGRGSEINVRLAKLGIRPRRRKRYETAEEEAQRLRWTGWRWMGPTR
jgi:hypothetical protein